MPRRSNEDGPGHERQFADALRQMTLRYENLIEGLSMLRQLDSIDDLGCSFDQVAARMAQAIAEGLRAETCSLLVVDEREGLFELRAAASIFGDDPRQPGRTASRRVRLEANDGIVGWAASTGRVARVGDVEQWRGSSHAPGIPREASSVLCVPLCLNDTVLGVATATHSQPDRFGIESEHLASLVAPRCARLVASHLAHEKQQRIHKTHQVAEDNAVEVIMVLDASGCVTSVNAAVEDVTGYSASDFSGGARSWDSGVAAEDLDSLRACRSRVRAGGHPERIRYRFVDAMGTTHVLEERLSAVPNRHGEDSALVAVIRDLTEREKAREEKRALEDQLRHAQKMEALGHLAGGVAHDFNNLLTGILGNVSLSLESDDVQRIRPLLAEAKTAAERAAAVVRQLLLFARRSRANRRPTDVCPVLTEVAAMVQSTFDRRIQFSVHKTPGMAPILADPDQVHQAVLNLCVNARDALLEKAEREPHGRLELRLEASDATFGEAVQEDDAPRKPGRFVCISVSDTGIGMSKETQEHSLEPFFTTKKTGEGTGLGLAIVYGIVKQHGGWLAFDTAPGEGATFRMYYPASDAAPIATRPASVPRGASRGSETVLVVDDEEIVRNLVKAILTNLGYTVLVAVDGEEGWDLYMRERERVDIVILDLSMPRLDGREVLRRIRNVDPAAKVMISSGHGLEPDEEFAPGFTPDRVLNKPYTASSIATAVREVLDAAGADPSAL